MNINYMYSRQYLNEQYKHSIILSSLFVGMCRCYEKLASHRQLLNYHRDYMKSTSTNILVSDKFNFGGEKYMGVNYLYPYISTEYSDYFLYEIRSEELFLVHTSTPVARSFLNSSNKIATEIFH
ncbi:uncharacterized protein LOC117609110 [Osmia lignaria lignaria]|uniref:uncharacterized protein LOC117609110 n=1 Tax=Osmia lignaria lignaria TaxID=1437193 RepID=UPI00402B8070